MPRVSFLNEVRVSDVYFVDKLAHELQGRDPISLADSLIREMRVIASSMLKGKGICFPMLVSSYLTSQGVHLPKELRVSTEPRNVIAKHQLRTFGYVCDGQGSPPLVVVEAA
ncbi:hypothetical protein Dimus_028893 [Dionaea muscipula]